jgi:hypothetical protein
MAALRDQFATPSLTTVRAVAARSQPEGMIDPIATARLATLVELLSAVADLLAQHAERVGQYPASTASPNRALMELAGARAALVEGLALLDEQLSDWKREKDRPIEGTIPGKYWD